MKIEHTQVFGFEASLRACRNPMDSWSKSDSINKDFCTHNTLSKNINIEGFALGEADRKLSQKLTKAGSEHCKHLRMIQVWVDLVLPRYIWAEMDTYKHLEKISCSTMHTLMRNEEITQDMFESNIFQSTLCDLNLVLNAYKSATNREDRIAHKIELKKNLPESFLQRRTINTNYQQLLNIYHQRKNHQLPEWHKVCDWIIKLPYFTELIGLEITKL